MLGLGVLDDLVMVEQILNSLLLPAEFVFQNFYLGFEFDVFLPHLVVKHLHFNRFVVKLLLFLSLQSVLGFGLSLLSTMRECGRKSLTHH